jgi:hypothetical protein
MASRNISLASGIHCCPKILFIFSEQLLYIVKNMVYIHISDCVQTVYELPLLPNSTASEPYLHKSGAVRSVDWMSLLVPTNALF